MTTSNNNQNGTPTGWCITGEEDVLGEGLQLLVNGATHLLAWCIIVFPTWLRYQAASPLPLHSTLALAYLQIIMSERILYGYK